MFNSYVELLEGALQHKLKNSDHIMGKDTWDIRQRLLICGSVACVSGISNHKALGIETGIGKQH